MPEQNLEPCRQAAGVVRPIVNAALCEGKGECVRVCPVSVFQVLRIQPETFRALPLGAKVKVWVHGMKTAETPNAASCEACGLCVSACPERAIRLERT